jgi:hypothetical protein
MKDDRPSMSSSPDEASRRRLEWLRRGTAATFAGSLLLTARLWLTERDYPLTPLLEFLPQPSFPVDAAILGTMLLALLLVVLLKDPRWPLLIVCLIALVWGILDQSRWQPYLFHPMAMLATMLLVPWHRRERWSPDAVEWWLAPSRLLLVFTYLYSGLEKLNHDFIHHGFAATIESLLVWFGGSVESSSATLLSTMALATALLEATAGLLLIFRRTGRMAVIFLTAMHVSIMILVGPLGLDSNRAILSWNIGMIVALWSLFGGRSELSNSLAPFFSRAWWRRALQGDDISKGSPDRRQSIAIAAIALLFGVMPIFGFPGWWDAYPSFALYSANNLYTEIWIDPDDHSRLPHSARRALRDDGMLEVRRWSLDETGAELYPERRIVLNIGRQLARRWTRRDVIVWIASPPDILTGKRTHRHWRCPAGGGAVVELDEKLFGVSEEQARRWNGRQ